MSFLLKLLQTNIYFISYSQCKCGQYDACDTATSNCNCDGTTITKLDTGKLYNKDLLPVQEVHVQSNQGKALIEIGNVYCADRTFGNVRFKFLSSFLLLPFTS